MGVRVAAAKTRSGAVQWAPPSVDLLHTPTDPPGSVSVVQVAYRSPFGAAAAAGKLCTRNAVSPSTSVSWRVEICTGLPQRAPPSVDYTTHVESSGARGRAPSHKQ